MFASKQCNIRKTVCINANDFSKIPPEKMIHHIDNSELLNVFSVIYQQLNKNGKVVIISLPVQTNYPFLKVFIVFGIPYENVILCMQESGFNVSVEIKTLPVTLQKLD